MQVYENLVNLNFIYYTLGLLSKLLLFKTYICIEIIVIDFDSNV